MAPKYHDIQCRLFIIALLAIWVGQTHGQTPTTTSNYFAPTQDLTRPVPSTLNNQNFTRCCLRAVEQWHKDPTGQKDIYVENNISPYNIFANPDDLGKANKQFPCGAAYSDDRDDAKDGAPQVKVSYQWCTANCGGWQRSRSAVLEQWVQPFVGFILPAAVFCLNVPRKKGFAITDNMFDNNVLEDIQTNWRTFVRKAGSAEFLIIVRDFFVLFLGTSSGSLAKLTISILFAAMIGFLNVVFWVIVVFSSAAPMILSGLYEATIDRQVIRGIEKAELDSQFNAKKNRESRKEPGTDEHPILQTQPTKDGNDSIQRVEHPTETPPADVTEEKEVSYQIHLLYAVLVGNLKLGPITGKTDKTNETHSIPKHRAWYDVKNLVNDLTPTNMESARRTKTRLTTMLGCQASFGASIGAPVAFYLGSFLFSVFGNRSKLGDSDISLALAFGEWWMIVPHVAIVSGCLLAGNNPNTLEAIVSGLDHKDDPSNDMSKTEKSTAEKFYWSAFYQSVYQPVWMWERGRNKRNWIKKVQDDYPHEKGNEKTDDNWARHLWKEYLTSTPLQEVPYVGTVAGGFLVLTLSVLIIVPFVLAYVTSFYTPTIGLSCRTFTFVLYFVFQALLAIVWFWDFLTEDGHSPLSQKTTKQWIIYCLATLFFIGSAFTAIIGTFMQIVGVYRNCLCSIPMGYWGSRSYHFTISSNSREGIYYASLYWVSTAIASICLLLIFCYFGWWYQRHWRNRFNNIVKRVLNSEKAEAEVSADGGSVSKPTATQEVVEEK